MKYTKEITEKLINDYTIENKSVDELALELEIPKRSLIAKLSSLGIYKRKPYVDKTGKPPVRKSELIDSIGVSLGIDPDQLDSLEKVTKRILETIDKRLKVEQSVNSDPKPQQVLSPKPEKSIAQQTLERREWVKCD